VIFQNNFPTGGATWLIAGLVLSFAITIQLYARKRRLDQEREAAALNKDESVGEQVLQNS
jgi:protoporphyrinogen IX oxidase